MGLQPASPAGLPPCTRGLSYRVLVPLLLGVIGLPAAGREDVLVFLVPAPQHHLACMRLRMGRGPDAAAQGRWMPAPSSPPWRAQAYLILLHSGVTEQPHIIMNIKIEEGPCRDKGPGLPLSCHPTTGASSGRRAQPGALTTFPSSLGDDEVVEAVVLQAEHRKVTVGDSLWCLAATCLQARLRPCPPKLKTLSRRGPLELPGCTKA